MTTRYSATCVAHGDVTRELTEAAEQGVEPIMSFVDPRSPGFVYIYFRHRDPVINVVTDRKLAKALKVAFESFGFKTISDRLRAGDPYGDFFVTESIKTISLDLFAKAIADELDKNRGG